MSDNAAKKSPRVGVSAGIHHANIRDKDRAVKRLRAVFRKINVKLSFENKEELFDSIVVLTSSGRYLPKKS